MAVVALHYKKYNISGLFFICSMFIRQNNIIWLLYGGLFICLERGIETNWKIFNKEYIIDILKKTWTYIIGIILIIIFIVLNEGLVIGDRGSHPLGIHTANIYYMLFMLFFMFLPSIMLRVKDMWNWGIKYPAISLLIIGGGILLALFNLSNNHWYNNQIIDGSVMNTGVVHNIIMMWAVTSTSTRILFAIPIIIAVFYLIVSKLKNPLYYLIYPFAILTVVISQMVESRYYIIPFALFLAFREEGSDREEYYLIGYFILLALVMFMGILRHSLIW
jgi:alpha-1,2-glucosyltransferase